MTVSLIGFRKPEEIDDAIRVAEWKLSDALLEEIDTISREAFERLYADHDFDPMDGTPNPENPNPPHVDFEARRSGAVLICSGPPR